MAKRLLLIGGGHAQLFMLEKLRRTRTAWHGELDVTLVTRDVQTPYSGMLPGWIAGHYRSKECHINLQPLAEAAGVKLVQATVDGLDLKASAAIASGRTWKFDVASIDIGSSLALSAVPGAEAHAVGVRPVDQFVERWRTLTDRVDDLKRPIHMVVVGGGAGGVEVVLAMAHRLAAHRDRIKWSLVTRGALLSEYPRSAAMRVTRRLTEAGIAVRTEADVLRVDPGSLIFADGSTAAFDALIWATGAAPQKWPSVAGLSCVDGGFIEVNAHLRSVSHPAIFAAGDIASDPQQRRPKAGVFAVRQGPVLAENILRCIAGKPLRSYRAQSDFLSLLSTGNRHAIAAWHGMVWEGDWLWRLKDRIDQRFMRRFSPPFV